MSRRAPDYVALDTFIRSAAQLRTATRRVARVLANELMADPLRREFTGRELLYLAALDVDVNRPAIRQAMSPPTEAGREVLRVYGDDPDA